MMRLAILGAGGHGRVVADAALQGGWRSIEFFDDRWPEVRAVGPWLVVGSGSVLSQMVDGYDGVVVAIGDNTTRLIQHDRLESGGAAMTAIVHPRAVVSPLARLGEGSVVFAGAILNPGVVTGRAIVINTGATVDHDCVLDDGVHIAPGAHLGGSVRVGTGSWIGIGASVRQGIRIGQNVVVGAGAAVVADTGNEVTLVGVPARPISRDHVARPD